MTYFHKHHLYGLLFRSSSSFNIIRLVLLGVFSFSPAMYSLPISLAVLAGLLLVAFIWDYFFYAEYRPIELLSKFLKTVPECNENSEDQDPDKKQELTGAKTFLKDNCLTKDSKSKGDIRFC